jgi:hypothetical protein
MGKWSNNFIFGKQFQKKPNELICLVMLDQTWLSMNKFKQCQIYNIKRQIILKILKAVITQLRFSGTTHQQILGLLLAR